MNPEFQKKVEEQINQLPDQIKKLILGNEWKQWVGQIVKKNTLNLDQASSLESEIFVFLIGLVGIFDLRKSIQTELNIPVSKVNDIMIDINDMIVEPLKQKLIAITDEDEIKENAPASIAQHVILQEKEEEILDRQKVLNDIENINHAPDAGVYVPKSNLTNEMDREIKNVQPIVENSQINTFKPNLIASNTTNTNNTNISSSINTNSNVNTNNTSIGANTNNKDVIENVSTLKPLKESSIFEAKMNGVVAPVTTRTNIDMTDKNNPVVTSKPSTDLYREPIQ
jgi:hypothetical protein